MANIVQLVHPGVVARREDRGASPPSASDRDESFDLIDLARSVGIVAGGIVDALGSAQQRSELAFNQERREGPTPSGGAYSIATYSAEDGSPASKRRAASVSIVEYSASGSVLQETYAPLAP